MKIAIVDDNDLDRGLTLSLTMAAFKELNLPIFRLDFFESGEEFLDSWKVGSYDLIVLDIIMGELSGIDVAHEVRKKNQDVRIVFCSTSNEFASESYSVNASYYLQKPPTKESIIQMIKRLNIFDYELQRFIVLPNDQHLILRDMIYSEYSNHLITIHLKDNKEIKLWESQKNFLKMLEDFPFLISCNQGNIINLHEVAALEDKSFHMKNNVIIPISRRKYKDLENAYQKFLFDSIRKGL